MGMTLEDSINSLIGEGKTFEQIQNEILFKWRKEVLEDAYAILDIKLLAGDFKVSRKEAKRLRPELFDLEDDVDFYMAGE